MYEGKRMAVIFRNGGNARVVCGRVAYEEDRDLGPVLRVELEPDAQDLAGQTTLVFREELLQDRLEVDNRFGCDLCVDLGALATQQESRPKGNRRKVFASA